MNSRTLRRIGCLSLFALALAGCGSDDEGSDSASKGDEPAKTEARTTPTADTRAAKQELLQLGTEYNTAFNRFKARLTSDVRTSDISAAQATTAQFRTAVFEYDAGLRKVDVGSQNQPQANTILGKSRTVISGLDSMSQATDLAAFRRMLDRVYQDNQELISANNELARALDG